MEFLLSLFTLSTGKKWYDAVDTLSLATNFIAVFILVGALLPPFFDVKKSKKTFGVSDTFFLYYVLGNGFMLANAVCGFIAMYGNSHTIQLFVLFCLFLCLNSFSFTLNTYIYGVKKANMRAAAAKGISEQEYWEQYLAPSAGVASQG